MKNAVKLARELTSKKENQLAALMGLAHEAPLDTVCFHAQQTVGKTFKALLSAAETRFPIPHDPNEPLA